MKSTKTHPRPDWFQFMLCKCQFKLHGDLVCKVCVSHLTEFVFHVPWYLKRVKNWSLLTALKITTKYCMLQIIHDYITRFVYFYTIFESQKRFFREVFHKILHLYMDSIQERVIMTYVLFVKLLRPL